MLATATMKDFASIDPAKANYGPSPLWPAVNDVAAFHEFQTFILRRMALQLGLPPHLLSLQEIPIMHDADNPTAAKSVAPPIVEGTDVIGTSDETGGTFATIVARTLILLVFVAAIGLVVYETVRPVAFYPYVNELQKPWPQPVHHTTVIAKEQCFEYETRGGRPGGAWIVTVRFDGIEGKRRLGVREEEYRESHIGGHLMLIPRD